MFRFAVVLFVVNALCSAKPPKEDLVERWTKAHEECAKSTGLEESDFMDAITSGSVDDKVKSQALCLAQTMKILDNKGKINKDEFKKQVEEALPEMADEINDNCIEEKDTAKDTAYAITKCLSDIYQKHNKD